MWLLTTELNFESPSEFEIYDILLQFLHQIENNITANNFNQLC